MLLSYLVDLIKKGVEKYKAVATARDKYVNDIKNMLKAKK